MGTPGNVLVGPVLMYHTDFVTGNDPVSGTQVVDDWSGWTALGYTTKDSGLTVTSSEVWYDNEVQEHNAPINSNLVEESAVVEFEMAESNALAVAAMMMGATYDAAGAEGTNANEMGVGDKATPVLQSFAFTGKGPDSTSATEGLIYYFPKMRSDGDRAITFHKAKDRCVKVRLLALMDPARTAGERLYKVFEVTTAP